MGGGGGVVLGLSKLITTIKIYFFSKNIFGTLEKKVFYAVNKSFIENMGNSKLTTDYCLK